MPLFLSFFSKVSVSVHAMEASPVVPASAYLETKQNNQSIDSIGPNRSPHPPQLQKLYLVHINEGKEVLAAQAPGAGLAAVLPPGL